MKNPKKENTLIEKWRKIIGFINQKSQQVCKCINQMNGIFQNKKQNGFTLSIIFIVKSVGIKILFNGTVTARLNAL